MKKAVKDEVISTIESAIDQVLQILEIKKTSKKTKKAIEKLSKTLQKDLKKQLKKTIRKISSGKKNGSSSNKIKASVIPAQQ